MKFDVLTNVDDSTAVSAIAINEGYIAIFAHSNPQMGYVYETESNFDIVDFIDKNGSFGKLWSSLRKQGESHQSVLMSDLSVDKKFTKLNLLVEFLNSEKRQIVNISFRESGLFSF